jgi:hypothetical protein
VTNGVFLFQNAFLCSKNRPLARDTANKLCLSRQQAMQQGTGSGAAVLGLPDMLWRHGLF